MPTGQTSFLNPFELSTLNGFNGFQLNGVAALDNSGTSVAAAGDVNGDGLVDFLFVIVKPIARTVCFSLIL